MLPTQQRFGAHTPCVLERDDRLEEQLELAALERTVQRVLGRVRGHRSRAHLVVEHFDAPAARLLRVVHRGVGVAEQLLRELVARSRQRDPDARPHEHLGAAHDSRADHGGEEALGDLDREIASGIRRQVLAQDRELVAAEPGDRVARSDHALELPRDLDEQLVAGVVAQTVVDVLEPVEIEERDTDGRFGAATPRDRLPEPVEEEQPVRQARERVVHRLVREPLLERLALDRDRRELREQEEHLALLVVGEPRLGHEYVERAEHRAAVARDDRDRPRRVQPVHRREVTVVESTVRRS